MFKSLHIETQSTCNRACATCIRQTYPDRKRVAGRAYPNQLPTRVIRDLLDEAAKMEFAGHVCLSHFNEPLQDSRIAELAHYARRRARFSAVYLNTNGELLTEELAAELDGALTWIQITLYQDADRRAEIYRDWFKYTEPRIYRAAHLTTHFSPRQDLPQKITENLGRPCTVEVQRRMIIGYDGAMRLCCEDLDAEWQLGSLWGANGIETLWQSPKHVEIVETLAKPGGRNSYPYCRICPRV